MKIEDVNLKIEGRYGVVEDTIMPGGISHWIVVAEFAPFPTEALALSALKDLSEIFKKSLRNREEREENTKEVSIQ